MMVQHHKTFMWIKDMKRFKKGLSFISNRQRLKEGTFSASELAGSNPSRPAPEEQGMPALTSRLRGAHSDNGPSEATEN